MLTFGKFLENGQRTADIAIDDENRVWTVKPDSDKKLGVMPISLDIVGFLVWVHDEAPNEREGFHLLAALFHSNDRLKAIRSNVEKLLQHNPAIEAAKAKGYEARIDLENDRFHISGIDATGAAFATSVLLSYSHRTVATMRDCDACGQNDVKITKTESISVETAILEIEHDGQSYEACIIINRHANECDTVQWIDHDLPDEVDLDELEAKITEL